MLCQRCNARKATVHFSTVAWPPGCETNHVCESCSNLESSPTVGSEPMMKKALPTAARATLRTRFRRKYARHLFSCALDLAARSIRESRMPARSIRGRVRGSLLAIQFLLLRRLSRTVGLEGKLTVFFREASGAPARFRRCETKA